MKAKLASFSRNYKAGLRNHLAQGGKEVSKLAQALGREAATLGLETLGLAGMHEEALLALVSENGSSHTADARARKGGMFFAEVITPIERTHRTAREADTRLGQVNQALRQRTADLLASNLELKQEIDQRKAVEQALRKSEQHYSVLLARSQWMQEQLRLLSRQLLATQEEERKKISRELHDEIAQTLTGINVQLAALKLSATLNTKGLQSKITSTQRLVEKSVAIVHRFARDLRPAVLDDLGLIPALRTFVETLAKRERLRVQLTVYSGVEEMDISKRTVLFRVAQEALTNVVRHARATRVDISIIKASNSTCMTMADDGIGFDVEHKMNAKGTTRLGLLGMRERVDMVGGTLRVESVAGKGTTVRAWIPLDESRVSGAGRTNGDSGEQKVRGRSCPQHDKST